MRHTIILCALVALAVPSASAGLVVHFSTPSKNIGCVGETLFIRCDIAVTRAKPPPKPRSCQYDWGNYFELRQRGRPRRLCVSDSALGSRRILGYGQTQRVGRRITCTSRRTGLTCRNRDGHGFFLSRERVRMF